MLKGHVSTRKQPFRFHVHFSELLSPEDCAKLQKLQRDLSRSYRPRTKRKNHKQQVQQSKKN